MLDHVIMTWTNFVTRLCHNVFSYLDFSYLVISKMRIPNKMVAYPLVHFLQVLPFFNDLKASLFLLAACVFAIWFSVSIDNFDICDAYAQKITTVVIHYPEAYSKLCHTFKIELFVNIVYGFQHSSVNFFRKKFHLRWLSRF